MNFVGKILVVAQLVLAVLFMVFSAVVYTAHVNWRQEAKKQEANLAKKDTELREALALKDTADREHKEKLIEVEGNAELLRGKVKELDQNVARYQKEIADHQVARKTAAEQAQIAGQDSVARKTEADNQRTINHELTMRRMAEFDERVKLEDAKRGLEIALDLATQKNRDLLAQVALYQQTLAANGISSDLGELAAKSSPPPGVDGEIRDVRPGRRQGESELVEVSLGSDDGLQRGHVMTVYRTAGKGSPGARYLAQIKIVNTTPDRAVGQVIENSRNGVIQKGDHVTTKL